MNRLQLFPDTIKIENNALTIAGQDLIFLTERFGTPLYLYDQQTLNHSLFSYKQYLTSHYPGQAKITYASKAFLCTAIAQWVRKHNLHLDCTGEGEIGIAKVGGVSSENIVVHGVNKSHADIKAALDHAGTIVVDNFSELERIANIIENKHAGNLELWLRLQPGLVVDTHDYVQTGQKYAKFGMSLEELREGVHFCQVNRLPLSGLHFHLGSQLKDPTPLKPAIELTLETAKQIGFTGTWHFSPGGGWGVAYHEDELPHPMIETYLKLIVDSVNETCKKFGLNLPHLHIEPGRSLIARAGVALYRVNSIKRQGARTWLLIDGGIADNPRYALYRTRYSALPATGVNRDRNEKVHIAGPYCESGDILIEDISMPKIEPGEIIAVPMSGAYQLSMSSNYNGARRPAVLWLGDRQAELIQRRETINDLYRRDCE